MRKEDGAGSEASPGAGTPEYPLRALVRENAIHYPYNGLVRGTVIQVRPFGNGGFMAWGDRDKCELFFTNAELDLLPAAPASPVSPEFPKGVKREA